MDVPASFEEDPLAVQLLLHRKNIGEDGQNQVVGKGKLNHFKIS